MKLIRKELWWIGLPSVGEVIYDTMMINEQRLGNDGIVMEINESKFGRRNYYRRHRMKGQ